MGGPPRARPHLRVQRGARRRADRHGGRRAVRGRTGRPGRRPAPAVRPDRGAALAGAARRRPGAGRAVRASETGASSTGSERSTRPVVPPGPFALGTATISDGRSRRDRQAIYTRPRSRAPPVRGEPRGWSRRNRDGGAVTGGRSRILLSRVRDGVRRPDDLDLPHHPAVRSAVQLRGRVGLVLPLARHDLHHPQPPEPRLRPAAPLPDRGLQPAGAALRLDERHPRDRLRPALRRERRRRGRRGSSTSRDPSGPRSASSRSTSSAARSAASGWG